MYPVEHVGIIVKDAEKSKEFYQKALGCKLKEEIRRENVILVFLQAGDETIELIQHLNRDEELGRGVVEHIAFRVDDIEEAIEQVKAAGAKMIQEKPIEMKTMKIIFFNGPDGEKLELVEKL